MSSRRATFEFQVLRSKNWTVQNLYDDEASAKKAAEQEMKSGKIEGVKIIRIWKRADGQEAEKVVFERMCQVKKVRDVRISHIEKTNFCTSDADILSPETMRTLSVLFRKYLDEVQITPMEVMHIDREYKRIWDTENILVSGIDRIAVLQCRDNPDMETKERTEELHRMVEAVGFRANRTGRKKSLPKRVDTTLGAVWDDCSMHPEDDLDVMFSTNLVLARDLMEQGSLPAKLARVAELLEQETDPMAIRLLDSVAAQIFACSSIFQDAIGPKSNLAEALLTLIDILEGGGQGFDEMLPNGEYFHRQIQGNALPLLREELFSRMVSMVSGTNPMSRNEPQNETIEFGRVANRLISADRVHGNGEVALALLHRACQFVTEGGAVGRKRGLEWLLRVLKTVSQRVRVLQVLDHELKSEPEIRLAAFNLLRGIITSSRSAVTFAPGKDMIAPMRNVTALYSWLGDEYPAKVAQPLMDHLDKLLSRYLEERQIIERVDRTDLQLADRATMLLNFILSGVLTNGAAMEMARGRVQEHLKRPDFIVAFAENYPEPDMQERKLREFHALLAKAGFSLGG